MPPAEAKPAADRPLWTWWLGAILFASTAALLLTGVLEWEHYRRILKWRYVSLSTTDRGIVLWLLWAKSVLPLLPVLLISGLIAATGRRKLASWLLAFSAMALFFWLAADLVMQRLTGSHVLDFLPYVYDALTVTSTDRNHTQWAGDTASIAWRSLLVLAIVAACGLAMMRATAAVSTRLIARSTLLQSRWSAPVFTSLFVIWCLASVPAQALFSQPLLLRRLHTAMPVDLSLFVPQANNPSVFAGLLGLHHEQLEHGVRIISLLPDPAGDDEGKEQATLHNFSDQTVNLDGWRLIDRDKNKHSLTGSIEAGQTQTITFAPAEFLGNDGDELALIDAAGGERHRVKYKSEMIKYGGVIAFREEGDLDEFLLKMNQSAQSLYHTMRKDLLTPRPVEEVRIESANAPHVVYLVLESFRASAISPKLMQRLDAWGKQGLRMNRHYAGSNSSHLGLFTLLYSRSPLLYYPTLEAGIPPQTTQTLRASGYYCSFITSGDCTNFRKMDRFLNEEQFQQVILESGDDWRDWPQRDRRAIEHVHHILQSADKPQFVMAFLMSTHFPYAFPPQWDKHQPSGADVVDRSNWKTFDAKVLYNRYQNAALCLEDEIMRLIDSLDPARHIIVITGDHGESMSEDGALAHASRGSEVQTRVPLLMVGPGFSPQVIEQPTTHSDVLPTLLHAIAGQEVKLENAHGRDVLSGEPLSDQVLICPYRWKDPYDLILIRGQDRMQFKIRLDRAWVEAYGFCDTSGNLDLNPQRQCTPKDATAWVEGLRGEMLRIAR